MNKDNGQEKISLSMIHEIISCNVVFKKESKNGIPIQTRGSIFNSKGHLDFPSLFYVITEVLREEYLFIHSFNFSMLGLARRIKEIIDDIQIHECDCFP